MSDSGGLFSKLGKWFRRRFSSDDELPLLRGETETTTAITRRPFFGWGRREEDVTTLQNGLASMSAMMSTLRQYLDDQNARHEELLTYLSQLSHALQSIPDTGRVQSETLRVLHQQIAFQNAQHKQLSEMLRKISESSGSQQEIVETLRDRVETLYKNDEIISETIQNMGTSIQVVTQQSQTNTMVLERLRDNLVNRDGELERAIRRENRWTRSTLVIVAAAALAALVISVALSLYSWSVISSVAESVSRTQSPPAQVQEQEFPAQPQQQPADAQVVPPAPVPESAAPREAAGEVAETPEPAAPADANVVDEPAPAAEKETEAQ